MQTQEGTFLEQKYTYKTVMRKVYCCTTECSVRYIASTKNFFENVGRNNIYDLAGYYMILLFVSKICLSIH